MILSFRCIFIFFLAICLFCCAGQKTIVCNRQSEVFEASIQKNSLLAYDYNEENQLFYILSNDDTNLYVNMRIPRGISQLKILRSGLTVWIDTDAKAREVLGIKFPAGNNTGPRSTGTKKEFSEEDRQIELTLETQNIELKGFQGKGSSVLIPSYQTDNIRGKIEFDENQNLNYKLIIPLVKISVVKSIKDGKIFSVGFESGTPNIGESQESRGSEGMGHHNNEGGESGMGSGHHGGGMGERYNSMSGDDMHHDQSERQKMFTPIKFWVKKVQLAP